jgi:hypothetical protein
MNIYKAVAPIALTFVLYGCSAEQSRVQQDAEKTVSELTSDVKQFLGVLKDVDKEIADENIIKARMMLRIGIYQLEERYIDHIESLDGISQETKDQVRETIKGDRKTIEKTLENN